MDLDELRSILFKSRVDVWSLINSAITVASLDYGDELRDRRDGIVQKLYFPTATSSSSSGQLCRNCLTDVRVVDENKQTRHPQLRQDQHDRNQNQQKNNNQVHRSSKSPLTPESDHNNYGMRNVDDVDDLDLNGGLFDDEQEKILQIRERLEDPEQDEESLVELLQTLVDMDITFKALQETDIGRVVSGFRKQHPSNEVRKLAKLLVRNWKETVDEWVRLNQPGQASVSLIGEESPQLNMQHKSQQNGHHQGSDFGYSPNPQNWGSGSEKNYSEPDTKVKSAPSREAPTRQPQSAPAPKSASAPPPNRQKDTAINIEKLNSARRRLQENYQEAQNAKKQRTIQVMDLHELPKPKNAFFAKNKGGFQGRNHR